MSACSVIVLSVTSFHCFDMEFVFVFVVVFCCVFVRLFDCVFFFFL